MKFVNFLVLIIFSIFLSGCESYQDSVVSTDNSFKTSADSPKHLFEVSMDLLDLDDVFMAEKIIDGSVGGEITLDTVCTGSDGNLIFIQAKITFEPNSFIGTKNISISPDPTSGSIKFTPAITFNNPVKLDLYFKGINLARLGFDANTKTDFVYMADDGTIEFILKNECKLKWNTKELFVKNAKLQHFSRYIFVR